MDLKKMILASALLNAANSVCSMTLPHDTQGHWLLSGDLGALWPQIHTTMNVDNGSGLSVPANTDHYSASSSHVEGMLAAAGGYRWTQHTQSLLPEIELALRYQYLFPQNISGHVTQFSLPLYENYSYRWTASANVLSAYTKLDLFQYNQVMFYFDAGLGVAFFRAQNYQETAFSGVTARVSPGFSDRVSSQFSYNIGAGIDFPIYPQLIFSVGYDYQSFGSVTSGPGTNAWSGTQLNLGRYGMNTALISFTYLFDTSSNIKT